MFIRRWVSLLAIRSNIARRTRRRLSRSLSISGLRDWLLEDRCVPSTVPTLSAAPPSQESWRDGPFSSLPGLTRIIDVSKTPVLDLDNNFDNQGTIYLVSTNPLVRNVSLIAPNIFNEGGAVITTVLPKGGLAGYGNAINDLSLTLIAQHDVDNLGAITSANSLTVLAGGTLTNESTTGSRAGWGRVQAVADLEVLAASVVNHGVESSTAGSVQIATPSIYTATVSAFASGSLPAALPQHIDVNNASGRIEAFHGTITIGGLELGHQASLTLAGGDFAAIAVNLQGGGGAIQANVDNVTGTLNVFGCSAQFASHAGVLHLGGIHIVGDPTFFNMGDISIDDSITVGENLAILATGNITATKAVVITASDSKFGGHKVFMVAGAGLTLMGTGTGSGTLPTIPPGGGALQSGQIDVSGASSPGGTISLHNSTIVTSATTGDLSGGSVTLVAFGGLGTGGISDVRIITGGHGIGANGAVTLIAAGTLGMTNTAISGITVDASGGTGLPAAIGLFAAPPMAGTVSFFATGLANTTFAPDTVTSHDIVLGPPTVASQGIFSAGGMITIKTGGIFTNQEVISSNGVATGSNAGNITIVAGSIDLKADLMAVGTQGAHGASALLPGLAGDEGKVGGTGGMISLEGTNGITIEAGIHADGASGGKGGDAILTSGGGFGGKGGAGGQAGSITLKTSDAAINETVGLFMSAAGGSGGQGGAGGNGDNLGDGGLGGPSVRDLTLFVADLYSAVLSRTPDSAGQTHWVQQLEAGTSRGQVAQTFWESAEHRGLQVDSYYTTYLHRAADPESRRGWIQAFVSGASEAQVMLAFLASPEYSAIHSSVASFVDSLYADVLGRSADPTGQAFYQTVAAQPNGRPLAALSILNSAESNGRLLDLYYGDFLGRPADPSGEEFWITALQSGATTPTGIAESFLASDEFFIKSTGAPTSIPPGGAGGKGGDGGLASGGGSLSAEAGAGSISLGGTLIFNGGSGGNAGAGGNGGNGLSGSSAGGSGGDAGAAQNGAMGGMIDLQTSTGRITVSTITAVGGQAGQTAGSGFGGNGIRGGFGGNIASGGSGGKGGMVHLLTTGGVISLTDSVQAEGGAGTSEANNAGAGGIGTVGIAGIGGSLRDAGDGGMGGSVLLEGKDDVDILAPVDVSGGSGGAVTGNGGKGGDGPTGNTGGSLGASGSGGRGGPFTVITSEVPPNRPGTITVSVQALVNATGGAAGAYSGIAGNGGNGASGNGGAGGASGAQGSGAIGGDITIDGLSLHVTKTGELKANGGSNGAHPAMGIITVGYHGTSGDGGNGGGDGGGGSGGMVGAAGSGGHGGTIHLEIPGPITLDQKPDSDPDTDTLAARGGLVSDDLAVSGKGGKSGANGNGETRAGAGGDIGNNGSAGGGGDVTIIGASGDMGGLGVIAVPGGKVFAMFARSGAGGDAGQIGRGGNSGTIHDNSSGGKGGNIIISSTSGTIGLGILIAAGGDVDGAFAPRTANGGNGGTISGNGGFSGDLGNNGSGGEGGAIEESSDSGMLIGTGTIIDMKGRTVTFVAAGGVVAPVVPFFNIDAPSQAQTGDGGKANVGIGGKSGDIGTNGSGGKGGHVTLVTKSGAIETPRGAIVTAGGDGGTAFDRTGNGGGAANGTGGKSGSIGKNSDGGDSGPITITSGSGSITIGSLILRGGSASSSADVTGNGGSALKGNGGNSGDIGTFGIFGNLYAGGSAGKGGTVKISTGASITGSESIDAEGGDAGALSPTSPPGAVSSYHPVTGDGGDGGSNGGNSGSIGGMGLAGEGGSISVSTIAPPPGTLPVPILDMVLDHMNVGGGRAGTVTTDFTPGGAGVQLGTTGNGGSGFKNGGNAGSVGDGVIGGKAGMIVVSSAGAIVRSTEFAADGGAGGDEGGSAGHGGTATSLQGGNGGAVGAAGTGGDAGTIVVTAAKGIGLKEEHGIGGNGGNNSGTAGAGGNGYIGGVGGDLGAAGNAGKGGSFDAETTTLKQVIAAEFEAGMLFYGGNGGNQTGKAGRGGDGNGNSELDQDSQGGNGGSVGAHVVGGAGGIGGSVTLKAMGGVVTIALTNLSPPGAHIGASVDGGNSGSYAATAGDGGKSSGSLPGGRGGDSGDQGDAGGAVLNPTIMAINIQTGSFTLGPGLTLSARGGEAESYVNIAGNGGQEGGTGGDGGDGGHTGSGGKGGNIGIITTNSIQIPGTATLDVTGGDRTGMSVSSGNGGNGGGAIGVGGNGGIIPTAGSAGGGGKIYLESEFSTVTDTGLLIASGGNVLNQAHVMTASKGGAGVVQGGKGGVINDGPGAALTAGEITVQAAKVITLGDIRALGGSVIGAFDAVAGPGGDNMSMVGAGGGGDGGSIGKNGNAGPGGEITLNTDGNITVASITAPGGSVSDMAAKSGNGGNQTVGTGPGGNGGAVGKNGDGGIGGKITMGGYAQSELVGNQVTVNGAIDLHGGSVGVFRAVSGDGGKAGPTANGTSSIGGGAGHLGDNGTAGDGGQITLMGSDGAVAFNGSLFLDGGNVAGPYRGTSGKGAKGPDGGGSASEDGGSNGAAGGGGMVKVKTEPGAITVGLIQASGGATSAQQGGTGPGGDGGPHGGDGGGIGAGAVGGKGGTIDLENSSSDITLNGDLLANGNDGGSVSGTASDGGTGSAKGGKGGGVGAAGNGGMGGTITVITGGILTINPGNNAISANGGKGGDQSGVGGKGGDSLTGAGGDGGDYGKAGNGGDGGTIKIMAGTKPSPDTINTSANGGKVGAQTGVGGAGGTGDSPMDNGKNGRLSPDGGIAVDGDPGTVTK